MVNFGPLVYKYQKACEIEAILSDENRNLQEKVTAITNFLEEPENKKIFLEDANGNLDNFLGDFIRALRSFFRHLCQMKTYSETFIEEVEGTCTGLRQ